MLHSSNNLILDLAANSHQYDLANLLCIFGRVIAFFRDIAGMSIYNLRHPAKHVNPPKVYYQSAKSIAFKGSIPKFVFSGYSTRMSSLTKLIVYNDIYDSIDLTITLIFLFFCVGAMKVPQNFMPMIPIDTLPFCTFC